MYLCLPKILISVEENHFAHRISKEELMRLPIALFDGQIVEVSTHAQVLQAVDYLNQMPVVGVDTETKPTFKLHEHNTISILQIATNERCFIFHLKQTQMPQELVEIFVNDRICKVGLAFHDDLRGLKNYVNFEQQNCIDLQKIVNRYGILDLSLSAIYAICFGKRISKNQRLTNWENPHLTQSQLLYAATDAWATLCIYQKLLATNPLPDNQVAEIGKQNDAIAYNNESSTN